MRKALVGRDKDIAAIRSKMATQLYARGIFGDLGQELEKNVVEATSYSDFRRAENERQLEAIKTHLARYIFNEDVMVEGFDVNSRN